LQKWVNNQLWGKKKTKDEKEEKENDISDSLPKKEDLSKGAKALRTMIVDLLKLIEEVDQK